MFYPKLLYIDIMKKLSGSFLTIFSFLFVLTGSVSAAESLCPPTFANLCNLKAENSGGIVGNIVTILFILAIVLALIYLVYGGIRYITSGGDKGKVDEARKHLMAAVIGLVIALLAYAIINVVSYVFTGKDFTEINIPRLLD